MKITTEFIGLAKTLADMRGMQTDVKSSVIRTLSKLAIDLQRHVVRDKLSGDPLKRRTGDLSRSVYQRVEEDTLQGIVGANTPYAGRQEYGFVGTESVRAHVRRSRAQMTKARINALGYETRPSKAKARGTGEVNVRAFSRNINYPAHSYLRSALDDMRGTISEQMAAAIQQPLKDRFPNAT